MKQCPKCKKTYKDDELNFCLDDGATLVERVKNSTGGHSRTNEIVSVALVALAILVFLCLVSRDPADPTFNTASSQKIQNWIGVVGANFAELLITIAGIVAYIFPALLALIAWRVFQAADLRPSVLRILGYVLLVASASALLTLFNHELGGMVGGLVTYYAVALLSSVGAAVLLTTLFLVSVLMISDLSFLSFWENFEIARENFKIHFNEWRDKREKENEERRELVKARMEKRRESRSGNHQLPLPTPTITLNDSPKTRTGNRKTAPATVIDPAEVPFDISYGLPDETPPPPTIQVPDTIVSDEVKAPTKNTKKREPKPNGIPITPVAGTGELDGEVVSSTIEVPTDADDSATPEQEVVMAVGQNYDNYVLPTADFLNPSPPHIEQKENELLEIADTLAEKTREFNVSGKVVNITPGPVVTTYEFKPDPGVKYSRVTGLVDDLCLALKAESIRIDRIPGKAYVGIEVPNQRRETIQLRDVIESKKFKESSSLLTLALGKTIDGLNYASDLAKMPHLLIAGATGAGKSVGVNTLVVSILYKARPDEVKFIMVDPKRLELGVYADIPHLATPIITDPKRAAISLKWAVTEMERRYKDLAGYGVRNIDGYNTEAKRRNELEEWNENGEPHRILPYIVIIIDELADLMMVSGKEVEESITRLAQMARAVGIHLVLATQRPSVDVITGLIKANFPARISFRVSSKVDSRTIIDGNGAEGLLGRGDMLFLPPASSQVVRVHGAYVDEKEISKVVEHIKKQGRPEYDTTITKSEEELDDSGELPGRKDPLFWDALKCVVSAKRGSTSLLQRHLRIGYGRAAAILDAMVREGYIGDMDGSTRARPILQKAYDDLADLAEMDS